MAAKQSAAISLLQLPDPCLLEVLRCCADDPRCVCNAARANSKLHQAAVQALSNITLKTDDQQRLHSLVKGYLALHGQHVDSISLEGANSPIHGCGPSIELQQLPATLTKLSSLSFDKLYLQLERSDWSGSPGVLQPLAAAEVPLKQLRLDDCTLYDGAPGLTAALALGPASGLERLSLSCRNEINWDDIDIPGVFPESEVW